MTQLAGYKVIAVVQRPQLDSYFTYWAEASTNDVSPSRLSELQFGFYQGIDDNCNANKPSFVETKTRSLFYLSGGSDAVRVDYYLVPLDAMWDFTVAVKWYSEQTTKESFFMFHEKLSKSNNPQTTPKSELFTDAFYEMLHRKGKI